MSKFCQIQNIDGVCKCEECGFTVSIKGCKITRICKPPTFIQKLQNLNKAGENWVAQGNPVPNEEEVQRRLNICKSCPLFRNGTCTLCGCNMVYKTKLATEHCPDNPPKW